MSTANKGLLVLAGLIMATMVLAINGLIDKVSTLEEVATLEPEMDMLMVGCRPDSTAEFVDREVVNVVVYFKSRDPLTRVMGAEVTYMAPTESGLGLNSRDCPAFSLSKGPMGGADPAP